jgi:hypothetical protein
VGFPSDLITTALDCSTPDIEERGNELKKPFSGGGVFRQERPLVERSIYSS